MPGLDAADCRRRLGEADHLVLATLHLERGPDLVPVVHAVDDDVVWLPVDQVKAKATTELRRLANIAADPRVCLLAEHYEDDWTRLWWVRAHGRARWASVRELSDARAQLAARYEPYRDASTIEAVVAVTVDRWTGWTAS